MATCLIDLCGVRGVEGFHLLQPLFYSMKSSGCFDYVATNIESITQDHLSRVMVGNALDRIIIFVEPGKGNGVLGQSLFVKLAKIKEKLLSQTEVKPENCVVIVLDSVERDEYTGRPIDKSKVATWELDFSGWLQESRDDLAFVFSARDYKALASAWGTTFEPSSASLYSNKPKEELAAADREELETRTVRLRQCCAELKNNKLGHIEAFQQSHCSESYIDELKMKIDDVFRCFDNKLHEIDRLDIKDGYGQFCPDEVMRQCVQVIWGVNGQSEDMSILWFQLPLNSSLYQRRIVELAFLTLALVEGRLEECLKQNVPRLFNVAVKLNSDLLGHQIRDYMGEMKETADRLQTLLNTGKLTGDIPTFQNTEFPPLGELKPMGLPNLAVGYFNTTGAYADYDNWANSLLRELINRREQAISLLNTCSDEMHNGLLQKPDMLPSNDLESERNKRHRELESKRPTTEPTHIPDNRKELLGKIEGYRDDYLKLSDVRPTLRPTLISLLAGLSMFAVAYMAGGTPMIPGTSAAFKFVVPATIILISICCLIALLIRYRRRLLSLVAKFQRDIMAAYGSLKSALTASGGVLNERYDLSIARRNFEMADKVFQKKAQSREFFRHHRDALRSHIERAMKLLEPFNIRSPEIHKSHKERCIDTVEAPAYRNSVYWPLGEHGVKTMVCSVEDYSRVRTIDETSLGTIELKTCRWQPH